MSFTKLHQALTICGLLVCEAEFVPIFSVYNINEARITCEDPSRFVDLPDQNALIDTYMSIKQVATAKRGYWYRVRFSYWKKGGLYFTSPFPLVQCKQQFNGDQVVCLDSAHRLLAFSNGHYAILNGNFSAQFFLLNGRSAFVHKDYAIGVDAEGPDRKVENRDPRGETCYTCTYTADKEKTTTSLCPQLDYEPPIFRYTSNQNDAHRCFTPNTSCAYDHERVLYVSRLTRLLSAERGIVLFSTNLRNSLTDLRLYHVPTKVCVKLSSVEKLDDVTTIFTIPLIREGSAMSVLLANLEPRVPEARQLHVSWLLIAVSVVIFLLIYLLPNDTLRVVAAACVPTTGIRHQLPKMSNLVPCLRRMLSYLPESPDRNNSQSTRRSERSTKEEVSYSHYVNIDPNLTDASVRSDMSKVKGVGADTLEVNECNVMECDKTQEFEKCMEVKRRCVSRQRDKEKDAGKGGSKEEEERHDANVEGEDLKDAKDKGKKEKGKEKKKEKGSSEKEKKNDKNVNTPLANLDLRSE